MEVLATDLLDKSRHRRTCPVLGACEPVATFVWQVAISSPKMRTSSGDGEVSGLRCTRCGPAAREGSCAGRPACAGAVYAYARERDSDGGGEDRAAKQREPAADVPQ